LKGEEYQFPYGSKWPHALKVYSPPELKNNPSNPPTQNQDLWGLGCIIWEVFNGPLLQTTDLAKIGRIPAKLATVYKVILTNLSQSEKYISWVFLLQEFMAANPTKRPKPSEKIVSLKSGSGFFKNSLIETMLFLEEIQAFPIHTVCLF